MSSFFQKLQDSVSCANSVDDLINIMRHIPLDSIKTVINQSLKSMNEDKLRSIHYEASSIDHVIPHDVIQSALSYIPHQKSTKYVSKSFKKATGKNEILYKRSREEMISSQFKGKNEWHLYGLELQKNDEPKQSVRSLEKVFDLMEDGDKLFLHEYEAPKPTDLSFGPFRGDGHYEIWSNYNLSKSIQIEGIGDCVITDYFSCEGPRQINIESKVSIKNVSVNVNLNTNVNGSLFLTDCEFRGWGSTLVINDSSYLDCFCCHFEGDKGCSSSAIYAEGLCSLSIVDCFFEFCGGCESDPSINLSGKTESIRLELIGNKFKNDCESPIGTEYSMRCKVNERAIIRNNQYNHIKADSSSPDILYAFIHQ